VTAIAASSALASVRVLLVDPQPLFRRALRVALERDHAAVTRDVATVEEAVVALRTRAVDVVLVDTGAAGDALGDLLRAAAGSAVVALSSSSEPDAVVGALAAGADGYLLKDDAVEDIVSGVTRAAAFGESLVSPRIASHVIARLRELEPPIGPADDLSPRELEVLRLLADGRENPQIARQLEISRGTVKNHVASILEKLGVANRVQAAVWAARRFA
jgi:NarL family two-component system response regulator LiaR